MISYIYFWISGHGGRVFIAEGEYSEALVINDDARIQATESAMNKATIKLVTSKVDTPTVDIKSGDVRFTGINFEHDCQGQDIWNGNSAVMIHGPAGKLCECFPWGELRQLCDHTASNRSCISCLEVNFANCAISSKSGRGVVAIRGARLMMSDSIVSNSAATGIYVGGDGTTGEISGCTVTDCGRGGHRVSSYACLVSYIQRSWFNFLPYNWCYRFFADTAGSSLIEQNLTSKKVSCTRTTSLVCHWLAMPPAQPLRAPS